MPAAGQYAVWARPLSLGFDLFLAAALGALQTLAYVYTESWWLQLLCIGLLAELARGVIFTGFPWIASGYAHVDGPLVRLAPWVGAYGIGAAAAFVASAVAFAWPPTGTRRAVAIVLVVVAADFIDEHSSAV